MWPVRIRAIVIASVFVSSLTVFGVGVEKNKQNPTSDKNGQYSLLKGKKLKNRMPASFGVSAVILDDYADNFKKEEKFTLKNGKQFRDPYRPLNPLMTDKNSVNFSAGGK